MGVIAVPQNANQSAEHPGRVSVFHSEGLVKRVISLRFLRKDGIARCAASDPAASRRVQLRLISGRQSPLLHRISAQEY